VRRFAAKINSSLNIAVDLIGPDPQTPATRFDVQTNPSL
jgi:hypothetical protein